MAESLYDDPNRVEETFVDMLTCLGFDRNFALRLSDGDANYPWPSLVRALRRVAVAREYSHGSEIHGLRDIVIDLVNSMIDDRELDSLDSTDHPGWLLNAHLRRLESDA